MKELTTRNLTTSMWWNPFTVERMRWRTPLSPDECVRRIQANMYSFWRGDSPERPFVGVTRRNRFTLYKNTPYFRNSFRPIAKVVILPSMAEGAIISIRLSLLVFTRIWWSLVLIGLGALLLLSGAGVAVNVALGPDPSSPLSVLAIAVVAGCVAYLLYVGAFWFSRGEQVFPVETLQRTLDTTSHDILAVCQSGSAYGRI